jgi:thiol-disulfide isomerase/thioredoxin
LTLHHHPNQLLHDQGAVYKIPLNPKHNDPVIILSIPVIMRTFCLILSALITSLLQAQDAREILAKSIQAINSLNKASYHIEIQQTNFLNGDTNKSSAECFVKRMPQDTVTKMYYYFSTGNSGFYKYNGTAYYSYVPEYYNFILRYSLKDNPEKFRPVTLPNGISPPEVTSLFFFSYSLLSSSKELSSVLEEIPSDKSKSGTSILFIKDTLVDDVRCFGFKIIKPRKTFSYNKLVLIDQHSFLPIAVIKDFKGGAISKETISVGQYSSVRYSNVKEAIPRFDYLMSDKSLPKKLEVIDHIPFVELFRKGDPAPAWQHPEVSTNKAISSDSLIGKIVVLDFTSTWCIHCVEGSGVIKELYQKYGDRKNVIFINVFSCSTDTRDKVQKYIKQRNIEGITVYNATGSEKPYGIFGYPDFFIIDRQGRIAYFQRGYSTNLKEILGKEIDNCLEK